MVTANFRCDRCKAIIEVYKNTLIEDFPETVKCTMCGGLETYRMWSMPLHDVCEGHVGNSKNNYENNSIVYHPSKYGSYKGKVIKTIR